MEQTAASLSKEMGGANREQEVGVAHGGDTATTKRSKSPLRKLVKSASRKIKKQKRKGSTEL